MKKIIKGRKYDTDTAKRICEYSRGYYNDLDFISEELYKKRTGEFFLYGEGGARSKYAQYLGNDSYSGGERIIPLTYNQAKEFAEKYADPETYEDVFGEVDEGEDMHLHVTISPKSKDKLQKMAVERQTTLSALLEQMIDEYVSI